MNPFKMAPLLQCGDARNQSSAADLVPADKRRHWHTWTSLLQCGCPQMLEPVTASVVNVLVWLTTLAVAFCKDNRGKEHQEVVALSNDVLEDSPSQMLHPYDFWLCENFRRYDSGGKDQEAVALSNDRGSGGSRRDRRCVFGTIKDENLGVGQAAFIAVGACTTVQQRNSDCELVGAKC